MAGVGGRGRVLRYRKGKTRGGRVGDFPEPERAVRGAPEVLRPPKGVARKVLLAWKILLGRKAISPAPVSSSAPAGIRL